MVASTAQGGILNQIIDSSEKAMPKEVARFFLDLSFIQADTDRMAVLSDKANEGDLLPAEREELATYVMLNDFIAILQSRARRWMKSAVTPA